ncbi:IS5 family transposase [Streptomyces sp. NPDC051976]|uniref:IS5 family transposase n=1 Tax=Streptomyces sp. NPDC051976 TaxID=3154947 RepID=UPI003421CBB8
MGRGDLTDAEWERLRPFLPVSNGRCGRWRDHRQVIDGILYRVRTGVQWCDLPERFGPWKTVYERHRLWSADGTWERLLQQVQAVADAAGEIDWDVSVDSTIVRAHQHAAGARTNPPPAPGLKGAEGMEHQDETSWQSLAARLVEVVRGARAGRRWRRRGLGPREVPRSAVHSCGPGSRRPDDLCCCSRDARHCVGGEWGIGWLGSPYDAQFRAPRPRCRPRTRAARLGADRLRHTRGDREGGLGVGGWQADPGYLADHSRRGN